jgi:AraC family transcriptional regulator
MLLKEFPDINVVKRLRNVATETSQEWRNVVLNFECREASRLALESPFSIFANNTGHSFCKLNKRHYRIDTDTFLFAQPGDEYGLIIDNHEKTELCNVHINRTFFNSAFESLNKDHDQLLDIPHYCQHEEYQLPSQLHAKDPIIKHLIKSLTAPATHDENKFETVLIELIGHLALKSDVVKRQVEQLPFTRKAVREELYGRMCVAKDFIYSNYNKALNLESICMEVQMSKFHFLRVFKSLYQVTPHQLLHEIRMQQAINLLMNTTKSITEIADDLGYEFPNSFIKAFQKTHRIAPLQFRRHEMSNIG